MSKSIIRFENFLNSRKDLCSKFILKKPQPPQSPFYWQSPQPKAQNPKSEVRSPKSKAQSYWRPNIFHRFNIRIIRKFIPATYIISKRIWYY